MKPVNRTDLAVEIAEQQAQAVEIKKYTIGKIPVKEIHLNKEKAQEAGRRPGAYITLYCDERDEAGEAQALANICASLIPKQATVLVAGLGNEHITPDSLGVHTAKRVVATAHFTHLRDFQDLGMRAVYVVETGVLAQTGIESAKQLKYIADGIRPDWIIVLDSLACGDASRLGNTIQITDAGISPGSGVKNHREEISSDTMQTKVLAIGVPLVMDYTIADKQVAMIVPRDIDLTIRHYTKVIAKALNRVLCHSLSEDEIASLQFFS